MRVSNDALVHSFTQGSKEALVGIDPDHATRVLFREYRLASKAGRLVRPLSFAMDVAHGEDGKAGTARGVDRVISDQCGGGRIFPKHVSGGLHKVRQSPKGAGKRTGHYVNRTARHADRFAERCDRLSQLFRVFAEKCDELSRLERTGASNRMQKRVASKLYAIAGRIVNGDY